MVVKFIIACFVTVIVAKFCIGATSIWSHFQMLETMIAKVSYEAPSRIGKYQY